MAVDETIDRTRTWLTNLPSPFGSVAAAVVGFGVLLSVFDLLKKTVFLNANWNYTYQYWNFVYNYVALGALLLVLALVVVTMPRWLELSSRQFAGALFLTGVVVFTLGLFALPLELTKALDVDKRGLYNGAVYLVNNGPIDFLRSFNSLPQTAPEHEELYIWSFNPGPENASANRFAEWMAGLDWVPFNDALADYVHGTEARSRFGPVHRAVPAVVRDFDRRRTGGERGGCVSHSGGRVLHFPVAVLGTAQQTRGSSGGNRSRAVHLDAPRCSSSLRHRYGLARGL